jgi:hypothetical protein
LRVGGETALLALVPIVTCSGVVALRRPGDTRAVAAVTFAIVAALQLFPRPDMLHMLGVAPLLLPLGLHVARTGARGWLPRGRATALVVAIALAVAVVRIAPTVRVFGAEPLVRIRVGDETLTVVSTGAERLRALSTAVQGVRDRAEPGVRVLTFPACAVVPFFGGGVPAGPHDYFYPGRPDAEEVALLARGFAAAPPPVAVTCDAAGTDLAASWGLHPAMVALLAGRYRPVVAAPPFHVLEVTP